MAWYLIVLSVAEPARALRALDMSGVDTDAVAVYQFDESGGTTAYDSSGVGSPLNLVMSSDGNLPTSDGSTIRTNAYLQNGYLLMNPKPNNGDQGYEAAQRHRTFLISESTATKLSQCTTGFTIQAFVRPWFPFQGSGSGNLIVGLSNSSGAANVQAPNFALYQGGQSGAETAMMGVRSGTSLRTQSSSAGAYSSIRETENPGKLTEIIATQEASGLMTIYINRIARSSLTTAAPNFQAAAKLVIGNELVPLSLKSDGTIEVSQQKNWSGEIHHLAIYCKGFSRAEILGDLESSKARAEIVKPQSGQNFSIQRTEARKLVERLSGVPVPIDHSMVLRVEERLQKGDRIGATKIVTGDIVADEPGHPEFLNTVIKQFALRLSNREGTIRVPLNDFAAAFMGVARDERNAKELLTGNFMYLANPAKAKVRADFFRDVLLSNNHFADLEQGNWDIGKVLMRIPGPDAPLTYPKEQMIAVDSTGKMAENPDPAGVITSRAFMEAHAVAGTNRRLVEYSFQTFLCVPMAQMADTSASPARIGRDIDRLPGGDATKFETSCKGCHTVMDGFRGAFARFDFASLTNYSFVRHTQINKSGEFGFATTQVDKHGIVRKMNHNENAFPNGFEITDESFVNNAVGSANRALFGWAGSNARGGVGVNQFGQMLADSERFAQCMAKRAYETVCRPGAKSEVRVIPVVDTFATKFKESGYKLRSLFQEVAANPNCAANMGR